MGIQTVTLELPDELYRRLNATAKTMNQSLEAILRQTIQGNLPPSLSDFPTELQTISFRLHSVAPPSLTTFVCAINAAMNSREHALKALTHQPI